MSHVRRNGGSALEYDSHELRKNWNHWVETGEELCPRKKLLEEGLTKADISRQLDVSRKTIYNNLDKLSDL